MSKFNLQLFDEAAIKNQKDVALKRGIRSLTKRLDQHRKYLDDPRLHCPEWDSISEAEKDGYIRHWNKEISNFKESICDRVEELEKRGSLNE